MASTQHLMVIVGTRPEAIKLAPVILAAQADPRFNVSVVSTGQHREMLAQIMDWFNITADHTLNVMEPGQPLARLTGKLLEGLHHIMEAERPDIVAVLGDTTTAFAGAMAAYYGYDYYIRKDQPERRNDTQRRFMQIAHIEAGLRTGDNYSPFPEEANRKLIGQLATFHFAPTANAAEALFDENITKNVFITGNTVIDALNQTVGTLAKTPQKLSAEYENCVLITGHRRENYGEGFMNICKAVQALAKKYPARNFVYPVHLNQHVQKPVKAMLGDISNVHLTDPLDYPTFVAAMQKSALLLTDSGGVQEEAPTLGKPVLVMRDVTERPEAVLAGTARVIGTSSERIIEAVSELLDNNIAYEAMANAVNPYGDGLATQRILNILSGENAGENMFDPHVNLASVA